MNYQAPKIMNRDSLLDDQLRRETSSWRQPTREEALVVSHWLMAQMRYKQKWFFFISAVSLVFGAALWMFQTRTELLPIRIVYIATGVLIACMFVGIAGVTAIDVKRAIWGMGKFELIDGLIIDIAPTAIENYVRAKFASLAPGEEELSQVVPDIELYMHDKAIVVTKNHHRRTKHYLLTEFMLTKGYWQFLM